MNDENNKLNPREFAMFAVIGVIAVAVGTDLTGRLLHFLYGEWPYICLGLVVLTFFGVCFYVHSDFTNIHWLFQKEVDRKLEMADRDLGSLRYENKNIRAELEFIRKNYDSLSRFCSKTFDKVDTLLEQKSPVIIETPQSRQEVEQSVHDAIQEVIGGGL